MARVAAIASDDQTLALDIASAWMANQPAQSMPWEWQQAVLMEGIQAVHRATGDEQLLRYLEDWIDFYLYRGYHIHSSDTLVPCTSAQYLYHVTGDPNYLSPINDGRDYLEQIAPRLEDGAIAHTRVLTHQIWEDSLFMFGTFLTLDASLLGRAEAFDELAEQFDLFADHLLSSSAGLYYHMYDETVDKTMPETPTFWGRGNGWVIASLAMMLTVLPEDHPDRAALEAQFRIHAEALMKWQDPSGLWWTVLDQPGRKDNYLETSASALNTFGLLRGYNLGLLDDRALIAAQNGLVGIRSRIDYDATGRPVVTGISGATNPGPYAYYVRIRTDDDLPYGVGAVLMALQEAAR